MADIHKLSVVTVGDGAHIESDAVLKAALGKLQNAAVIGWDHEGSLYFASTDGGPDTLWLLEQARKELLDP